MVRKIENAVGRILLQDERLPKDRSGVARRYTGVVGEYRWELAANSGRQSSEGAEDNRWLRVRLHRRGLSGRPQKRLVSAGRDLLLCATRYGLLGRVSGSSCPSLQGAIHQGVFPAG